MELPFPDHHLRVPSLRFFAKCEGNEDPISGFALTQASDEISHRRFLKSRPGCCLQAFGLNRYQCLSRNGWDHATFPAAEGLDGFFLLFC